MVFIEEPGDPVAAAAVGCADGLGDAWAWCFLPVPGSRPMCTPGPDASGGSWSTQPAWIDCGSSRRPPLGWARPLFRSKISWNRLPLPSVLSAIAYSVTGGWPCRARGTM